MNDGMDIRIPGFTVLRPSARGRNNLLLEARDDATRGKYGLVVLRDVPGTATTGLREALAPLRGVVHDNLVRLVAVQRTDGHASLLIDLVEGPTLAQALADGSFTIEQVDDLGRGILAGLAALHAAGITHPRLSPDDVLLSVGASGPVPKLLGGGVVAAMGGPADVREDVRGVGLLLHALLTGHVADPDETLVELGPEVPERMAQAIVRALRVDVDARARSARELLAVWEGVGEPGTERVAPARAWDERTVKRIRRLWSDRTPVENTWEDFVADPRIVEPDEPSWIPYAFVFGLLGFLAFLGWWGGS